MVVYGWLTLAVVVCCMGLPVLDRFNPTLVLGGAGRLRAAAGGFRQ
jgi:hypothetical protein